MDRDEFRVLIIYDIENDKKRNKYSEYLCGYGYRVQKSCFEAILTRKKYKKIIHDSRQFFNKDEDSIRIYVLSKDCSITCFGIPEEIISEKFGIV